LHFQLPKKFGPSWQARPAIVAGDRPAPDKKCITDPETARLRAGWGAQVTGLFAEVLSQGK